MARLSNNTQMREVKTMRHPSSFVTFNLRRLAGVALRSAAVALVFFGAHLAAWRFVPEYAFAIDLWLSASAAFGLCGAALVRWRPKLAERVAWTLAVVVGGSLMFAVPHVVARLIPHGTLLLVLDAVAGLLAITFIGHALIQGPSSEASR